MEEGKVTLDVVSSRVERLDSDMKDMSARVRELERTSIADYQWRKATDKALESINAKLEELLAADGKTYNTAKLAVITSVISVLVGYLIGAAFRL